MLIVDVCALGSMQLQDFFENRANIGLFRKGETYYNTLQKKWAIDYMLLETVEMNTVLFDNVKKTINYNQRKQALQSKTTCGLSRTSERQKYRFRLPSLNQNKLTCRIPLRLLSNAIHIVSRKGISRLNRNVFLGSYGLWTVFGSCA